MNLRFYCLLVLSFALTGCRQSSEMQMNSAVVVDHAFLRVASAHDAGTLHLFLRNVIAEPLAIESICVDGERILDYPDAHVLWWQLVPSIVESGKTGDLMVKMAVRPERDVEVKMDLGSNGVAVASVPCAWPLLKLANIAFSSDYSTAYVYIENTAKSSDTVKDVYWNNVAVSPECMIRTPTYNNKTCLVLSLAEGLNHGEYVSVKVVSSEGDIAEGVVKVFSGFPVGAWWEADTRSEYGFDDVSFERRYLGVESLDGDVPTNCMCGWLVAGCPACRDNKKALGSTAKEIIERNKECMRQGKVDPTYTHMCSYRQEYAYAAYSEITDMMFVNPFEVSYFTGRFGEGGYFYEGTPFKNYCWYKMAKALNEPRPIGIIPAAMKGRCGRYNTPEELRLTVYYGLAAGARGVMYFCRDFGGKGYDHNPELLNEIGVLNRELRFLRPLLQVGEPVDIVSSNSPEVFTQGILCGNDKLLLIVCNQGYENYFGMTKDGLVCQPKSNVEVNVQLPGGISISGAYRASPSGWLAIPTRKNDNCLNVVIDRLCLTEVVYIDMLSGESNK